MNRIIWLLFVNKIIIDKQKHKKNSGQIHWNIHACE